jgi:trigger factor
MSASVVGCSGSLAPSSDPRSPTEYQEVRLNATVEALEGSMMKVTVTVPAEQVDKAVAAAYREIAAQVRIPGFRKGKVPRPVLDTQVGRSAILAHAAEELVSATFPQAIEDLGLVPAEPAEIDEIDEVVEGSDYTYDAEVLGRPEVELASADGITVEAPPATVRDEEIDAQVDHLRQRFASLEPVEDRGVEPGDFVVISFVGLIDGEPYENNEVDGLLYELGQSQMPQEFEDSLLGARPGDQVVAEFTIPESSSVEEYVGKAARFDTTVSEIKAKALPPVDDEFAASVGGFGSVQEMRDDIRERLTEARIVGRDRTIESEARAALTERVDAEVPEALIDAKKVDILGEFRTTLEQRQMTLAQYLEMSGLTREQVEIDITDEARKRLREEFALEALFRLKDLEVTSEDIDESIAEMADSYETEPAELKTVLMKRSLLPEIRVQIMHRKATEWLVDNVEVIDVEPTDEKDEPAAGAPTAEAPTEVAAVAAAEAPAEATAGAETETDTPDEA